MSLPASAADPWLADVIDLARQRIAAIGDALALLVHSAGALATEARWQSDAATAFRCEMQTLCADVAALAAEVEALHDELAAARARAVTRAGRSMW